MALLKILNYPLWRSCISFLQTDQSCNLIQCEILLYISLNPEEFDILKLNNDKKVHRFAVSGELVESERKRYKYKYSVTQKV